MHYSSGFMARSIMLFTLTVATLAAPGCGHEPDRLCIAGAGTTSAEMPAGPNAVGSIRMQINTGVRASDLKSEQIAAVLVTPHLYADENNDQVYSATVRQVAVENGHWVIGLQVRRDDNNGGTFHTRKDEVPPRFAVTWDWLIVRK